MDGTIAQARLTIVPANGPTRGILQAGYLSILIQQIIAYCKNSKLPVHYNLRTRCDMTKGKVKEVLKMGGFGRIPVPNLNLKDMTISILDITFIIKFLPSVAR